MDLEALRSARGPQPFNRDPRHTLALEVESDPARRHRVAARTTRTLRLLRAHGLIYRRVELTMYHPTEKGYQVIRTALKFRQTDFALLAA
jgi:hypothetical protein